VTDANRNLLVRIASAVVRLPVVVFLFWLGPSGTAPMIAVAAILLAHELYAIVFKKHDAGQVLAMIAAALPAVVFSFWPDLIPPVVGLEAVALLLALFAYYLIAGPLPEAPVRVSVVFMGFFYCGVLPAFVAGLRALPHGLSWVFMALLLTWGNDTGAYAFGLSFVRMMPSCSAIGGMKALIGSIPSLKKCITTRILSA
jgi:phosphatidate cytidylyltransferase